MFVLYALSLSPQATCHSRGGPALPGCAQVHNTNKPPPPLTTHHHWGQCALAPLPYSAHSPYNTAIQRETKPNWKETKWPHAASPVKALDRPEPRPPEEGSVEDDDGGDNKSSCCVIAQLHFGPCLSIWLFRSIAELTDSHACQV